MKTALHTPSLLPNTARLLTRINEAYHLDENAAVREQLDSLALSPEATGRIRTAARGMVETVRANRRDFGGVDRFLNEFGLTTAEGIALMCLAEALLRIPDSETADRLIRDKIGGADWDKHLGGADDLFVNASTWALMLTGKVIGDGNDDFSLRNVVARVGEPVVRQAMLHAMKIMGRQFVMGRTIDEALSRARDDEKKGYRHSYDMLGEGARTAQDAERYFKSYETAIDAIGKAARGRGINDAPGISVKLSAIHPRYEYAQREACVPALAERLLLLAKKCAGYGIGLTVDAEESYRLEISLEIFEKVYADPALKGWEGFGLAVQAYQKRCSRVIDFLAALAEKHGRRMQVRLVKGAYWDTEVKYAQVHGLPGYPVFTRKNATDVSFLASAQKMLARRDVFYPMFATHNAWSVCAVMELAGQDQGGFEFQRLHGMGEPLYHQITGTGEGAYPCRVYSPVGSHQDLLPYLVRRLLENGANTNFVNRLQDDKVPVDEILTDPVAYIRKLESKPHPKIPLPADIYKSTPSSRRKPGSQGVLAPQDPGLRRDDLEGRENSRGVEFANSAVSADLLGNIEKFAEKTWSAAPLVGGKPCKGESRKAFDPADNRREIGAVTSATKEDMALALETVHAAWPAWNVTPADERAACLERAADLMEQNMAELMAICVREGGKCLPDALAEVREAVDFCRYYAAEGRAHFGKGLKLPGPTGESNELFLEGRGVFLCISPWNFPLAIFMGQVTAALMAGNAVIAKPAGQTPLIAMKAAELLLQAGVPKNALAFLPASGRMVGEVLVPDERVAGVCFTGSTETAQQINRALAARKGAIPVLIAETGGQNAMIVDSSALPEQVVDDVIMSAFRSAGQRCSALRLLFLQERIADKVIEMLAGACRELRLGDPLELSTDIGPVIDKAAMDSLRAHATRMAAEGKMVAEVPLQPEAARGTFLAPCAFEIKSADMLKEENFGPILHIVRYKPGEMDKVIDQINKTGYGLTFGIHTRIDRTMREAVAKVRAGNCYVNRSMIGAVVGVQPFGGQNLSGTGPKAGGPHYLPRFATEKTLTVNTTASGGNTTLVSLAEE